MKVLFNLIVFLLALIGLAAVAGAGLAYGKMSSVDPTMINASKELATALVTGEDPTAVVKKKLTEEGFDPEAFETYKAFATKLWTTKDPGDAMVWAIPVDDGISAEDVKTALKSLAVERDFLFVGESPFYEQVEAVTGEKFRHVSFLNFCDVRVGVQMLAYNNAYSAFMPCTISVVEDEKGKLWLYAINMDFLIHGGKELPAELKEGAIKVRTTLLPEMMQKAAKGEF
jgi:hypothetical protein